MTNAARDDSERGIAPDNWTLTSDGPEGRLLALDPALYTAQIDALIARGDTWLEVEHAEGGFVLGRYDAGPIERDTNGWEPLRLGDGPDDGPLGNTYPDEVAARQAAIAYNGADLAGMRPELALDLAPDAPALDQDTTPSLDL